MKSQTEIAQVMKIFFKEVGVPDAIVCDSHKAQVQGETKKLCQQVGTVTRMLETGTPWANRAELYIGLVKRRILRELKESNCPMVLWDYCAEWVAQVNNSTAKGLYALQGQTPHFTVTGQTPDISNLCQFAWYDWCFYFDDSEAFPHPKQHLGRVLGPAKNAANEMAQWILKSNGRVVPR